MVSQNWEQRSATAQIVSDVSGLIIHKNERYWYNTDFEINCKSQELIQGRQIVRVIAHPMTISNFPSDYPDAAALLELVAIHTTMLGKLTAPPEGTIITKLIGTRDGNDDLTKIEFYEDTTLLFTLDFDPSSTDWTTIERTDA